MTTIIIATTTTIWIMREECFFRRIDLKFISFKCYYYALLYFTGNDNFNRDMRLRANKQSMIFNENGLFALLDPDDHSKKGDSILKQPKSENDIFDAIGMEYVEPENRK